MTSDAKDEVVDGFEENVPLSGTNEDDADEGKISSEEESDAYFAEVAGYDRWPEDVAIDFSQALTLATINSFRVDFATTVAEYRAIEAKFLPRFGNHAENAQQVRRHITEMVLDAAMTKKEPFETCLGYWNELLQLGFYRIERRCRATWSFADCCRTHGQRDIGLAVLNPLMDELERLRAEPDVTKPASEYFRHELETLGKLRAKLEAQSAVPH
jgi:hypothetical protein